MIRRISLAAVLICGLAAAQDVSVRAAAEALQRGDIAAAELELRAEVRAREVLESALRQQPENADVLYRLAVAEEALKQFETALGHLAHAAQIAPKRADVQKLLAFTATELGALPDAAAAWDRYLKLAP